MSAAGPVAFACCALPATSRAVPEIRCFAATVLAAWGAEEEFAYAVTAIVSELVTNVVRHSGSAHVELRLTRTGEDVRIEVCDGGAWRPAPVAETGELAESGRGLLLVRQYAVDSGIVRSALGTRVWALVAPLTS